MELPFVVPFEDRVKVSVRLKFGYTLLRRVTQFNVFQQTHFTVLVAFFLVNLIIKLPAYSWGVNADAIMQVKRFVNIVVTKTTKGTLQVQV